MNFVGYFSDCYKHEARIQVIENSYPIHSYRLFQQAVEVGKSTFRHPEVKALSEQLKLVKAESVMKHGQVT